jgi:hypothetical protein
MSEENKLMVQVIGSTLGASHSMHRQLHGIFSNLCDAVVICGIHETLIRTAKGETVESLKCMDKIVSLLTPLIVFMKESLSVILHDASLPMQFRNLSSEVIRSFMSDDYKDILRELSKYPWVQ